MNEIHGNENKKTQEENKSLPKSAEEILSYWLSQYPESEKYDAALKAMQEYRNLPNEPSIEGKLVQWLKDERNILQNTGQFMWQSKEAFNALKVAECLDTTIKYIEESISRNHFQFTEPQPLQEEGLDEAAKNFADNQANHFLPPNDKTAFKAGAEYYKQLNK